MTMQATIRQREKVTPVARGTVKKRRAQMASRTNDGHDDNNAIANIRAPKSTLWQTLTKNYGKSPFLMGKSTISMARSSSQTVFVPSKWRLPTVAEGSENIQGVPVSRFEAKLRF